MKQKEPKEISGWEKGFDKKWNDCFPTGGESRYNFQKQEIENFIRIVVSESRSETLTERPS